MSAQPSHVSELSQPAAAAAALTFAEKTKVRFPKNPVDGLALLRSHTWEEIAPVLESWVSENPARIRCFAHWMRVKNAFNGQSNVRYQIPAISKQYEKVLNDPSFVVPEEPVPANIMAAAQKVRGATSETDHQALPTSSSVVTASVQPQAPVQQVDPDRRQRFVDMLGGYTVIVGETDELQEMWAEIQSHVRQETVIPSRGFYPQSEVLHVKARDGHQEALSDKLRTGMTTACFPAAFLLHTGPKVQLFRRKEKANCKLTNPFTTLHNVTQGTVRFARVGGNSFEAYFDNEQQVTEFASKYLQGLQDASFLAKYNGDFLNPPNPARKDRDSGTTYFPVFINYVSKMLGPMEVEFMAGELGVQNVGLRTHLCSHEGHRHELIVELKVQTAKQQLEAAAKTWKSPFSGNAYSVGVRFPPAPNAQGQGAVANRPANQKRNGPEVPLSVRRGPVFRVPEKLAPQGSTNADRDRDQNTNGGSKHPQTKRSDGSMKSSEFDEEEVVLFDEDSLSVRRVVPPPKKLRLPWLVPAPPDLGDAVMKEDA